MDKENSATINENTASQIATVAGEVSAKNALVGLQGQLDTIRTEIFSTNAGLQNIATLIQTDSAFDQQRLLQEREQERLLAEREIRVDQVQELQQKVSDAITQPVVKLEKKLTSTFDGVTSALSGLFGFVGTSVLSGLQSAAKISLKALTGIGGLIRNSFNAIGSGLSALRGGFGAVIESITGVAGRISKAILSLAASPFKAIKDVFKKFLPGAKPTGAVAAAEQAGGGASLLGLFGKALTSVGGAIGLAENIKEKDVTGAFLSGASIVPSPIQFPAALASFGYEAFGGKNIDMSKVFPKNMFSLPKLDFGAIGKSMSEMGQNVSNFFGINLDTPGQQVQGNVDQGNSSQTPAAKPGPTPIQTTPFTPPAKPSTPVGQLPEAKPDIIYTSTGQQNQTAVVSGETQTITDVPLIPSSNPDNFYTLYAQVNYNVVM